MDSYSVLFYSFQDNKADVKSIMARFQASGSSTDETSSTPGVRPKPSLQPTLSGPAIQKKPVLESLSSGTPIKPSFLKNTPSTKSDTDSHEPNKAKALANRFANKQEDSNTTNKPPLFNKQQPPLKSPLSQSTENKFPAQKPPFNKPSLNSTLSESKIGFPKPYSAPTTKPSWVKEDSGGGTASNTSSTVPKAPNFQPKPSSSIVKLRQQNDDGPSAGANTDAANKPSPLPNSAFKTPSNFRNAQNMFKEKDKTEQTDSGGDNKPALSVSNSAPPPPKPPASKKPSIKKPIKPSLQRSGVNGDATSGPKRNPLPNSLALGPPPAKPNRPPKVNLENFKKPAEATGDGKLGPYTIETTADEVSGGVHQIVVTGSTKITGFTRSQRCVTTRLWL